MGKLENREFNKSATTLLSNVVSIASSVIVSFFASKYIIEFAGKEAYSFYPIAVNFATYFSVIFLTVNSVSVRLIMIPFINNNKEEASEYYSTVFVSGVFISLLVLLLEVVFYVNLNNILNIPNSLLNQVKELFIIIFIMSIINGITSVFCTVYYVKNRMELYAVSSIVESAIKGVVILLMIINKTLTIVSFGYALLISSMSRSLMNILFSKVYLNEIKIKKDLFSFQKLKKIISLGLWSVISTSGALLISNIQLMISNVYLGVTYAAELALIQPIITLCSLINSTARTIMEPNMIKMVSSDDTRLEKRSNLTMIILIYIPSILLMCLGKPFYELYLPNENSTKLAILSFFGCFQTLICYATSLHYSSLSTFFKEKEKAVALLVAGVLNIFLMFILLKYSILENIALLLAGLITNTMYYIIYIPMKANKEIRNNDKTIHFESMKNYLFLILLVILNLILAKTVFTQIKILNFLVICIFGIMLDYAFFYLFYHKDIKEIGFDLQELRDKLIG